MLERLCEMRWPLSAVLSNDQVTKRIDRALDLTNDQWLVAEELVAILKPFEVATTFLCAENQPTISSTLPLVCNLIAGLEESNPDEDRVIVKFKKAVVDDMKRRWEIDDLNTSSCMVLAAMLDPRFKPLKCLDEDQIESVKVELVKRIESLPSAPTEECTNAPKKSKTAMDILFGDEDQSTSGLSDALDEVTEFMAEKSVSKKTSALTWWKDHSSTPGWLGKL